MAATAAITPRETHMITSPPEETATAPAIVPTGQPKPATKASVGKRVRHVSPARAKSGKKATPAKKAATSRTKAKVAKPQARRGSKTAKILDLLRRSGGVTAKELMKATGWQPHSVRGFLSGTVCKRMGLKLVSTKGEAGMRTYSIKP